MKKLLYFVISLAFAVSGLAYGADTVVNQTKQGANSKTIDCPSQDFKKFMKVFIEDVRVQEEFTKYPLRDETVYDTYSDEEDNVYIIDVERKNIDFPLIPDKHERKKWHFKLRIDNVLSNRATISLTKDDTGLLVYFDFIKDSCWRLVRVRNEST